MYNERFERDFGFYRPVISEVVRAYLKCGDLKEGFARVRCPDCHHEYLLAFSCRGRWFCPSCHARKVVQFGELLRENILYPLPHRQYVFSIPIILLKFFLYNRKLLSNLCRCAAEKQELEEKEREGTDNEIEIIDVSDYKPRKIPPPTWRECTPRAFASRHIKKIWEVDPLQCPRTVKER